MRHIQLVILMAGALILLAACGVASPSGGSAGPSLAATAPAAATGSTAPATAALATAENATATSPAAPTEAVTATIPSRATEPAPTATNAPSSTAAPAAETPASAPAGTSAVTNPASGDTIVLTLQPGSEASYKVREQLANVNLPNDAVGTTNAVTGTISIKPDGTVVKDQSRFAVDLSTLRSDKGMRDNYIKRNTLQTDTYPQAVFVPAAVEGLPSPLPASGDVNFKMTGDLTIRDVTRPVTWDVQAKIAGNELTGTATTSFKFGDFGMTAPRTMMVLSIEDNITLEIKFRMTANQ